MTDSDTTTILAPLELLERAEVAKAEAYETSQGMRSLTTESERASRREKDLREQAVETIQNGATTGDLAFDMSIIATRTTEKGPHYELAQWLITALAPFGGELLLLESDSRSSWLGVVPVDSVPMIAPKDFRSSISTFGYAKVLLTQNQMWRLGQHYALLEEPVMIELVAFLRRKNEGGDGGLVIGDAAVTDRLRQLPVAERLVGWMAARELGHAFDADDELQMEIQRRREEVIIQIYKADTELWGEEKRLQAWKDHPASFFEQHGSRIGGAITPTDFGVVVDFGLEKGITSMRQALSDLLKKAHQELLMSDNPTWHKAAVHVQLSYETGSDSPES